MAALLDSVAPEVKIISRGSAFITEASYSRAKTVAFSVSQPY